MREVEQPSEAALAETAIEVEEIEQDAEQEELEHVMARHMNASKAWLFASILITLLGDFSTAFPTASKPSVALM